jgi:hypothetical protein
MAKSFGVLLILPRCSFLSGQELHTGLLALEPIEFHFLNLPLFASSGALILYAFSVKHLGAVKAKYLQPDSCNNALLSFLGF